MTNVPLPFKLTDHDRNVDTVSFLVPLERAGEALTLLQNAKSNPFVRWVSRETRAPLTARQKALAIAHMNGRSSNAWQADKVTSNAGILIIFDDKNDALIFKLTFGGAA